jgi:hypothetical protein
MYNLNKIIKNVKEKRNKKMKKITYMVAKKIKENRTRKRKELFEKAMLLCKKNVIKASDYKGTVEELWFNIADQSRNLSESISKYISLISKSDKEHSLKIISAMNKSVEDFLNFYKNSIKSIDEKLL